MARTTSAFNNFPPWMEQMQKLQQQMRLVNEVYTPAVLSEVVELQSIVSRFDFPAIHEMQQNPHMYSLLSPQIIDIMDRVQPAFEKCLPLVELQARLSNMVPDLTHSIFDYIPSQYNQFIMQREQKALHLSNIADSIANYDSLNDDCSSSDCELSAEDYKIIVDEVKDALDNKKHWEQKVVGRVAKFRTEHPKLFSFFQSLILAIMVQVIANLCTTAIGKAIKPATVREEPISTSTVVYQVSEAQTILVIGEVPYYYEVEVIDGATQKIFSGYISKKVVQIYDSCEANIGMD